VREDNKTDKDKNIDRSEIMYGKVYIVIWMANHCFVNITTPTDSFTRKVQVDRMLTAGLGTSKSETLALNNNKTS